MTTTPEYIRKCEMAEEIQAMRAPKDGQGDYLFEIGDYFAAIGNQDCSIEVYGSIVSQPCGLPESNVFYREGDWGNDTGYDAEKIIWLPRLDQLLDISDGMSISLNEAETILGDNREEKFFDVIMKNKFGKEWDGEKWI